MENTEITQEEKYIGAIAQLSPTELQEIQNTQNHQSLIVSGFVDFFLQEVVVFKMDGSGFAAPFILFNPSGKGNLPDFSQFSIIDHGNTLKFGEYEADSSLVLYQVDKKYKAMVDQQRQEN